MTYEEARKKVEFHLQKLSEGEEYELAVIDDATIARDYCWVFFYNSKKYLEKRNFSDMIVGNAPILIDKRDGTLHETGTAYPIEHYIRNFEKYGTCYPSPR